jgi:hemoglobin-like flavoprotein
MALNAPLLEWSLELVAPTGAAKQACGRAFYTTLSRLHPEVKPLLAQTNMEEQARKLMATLSLVVHALKNPEVLASTMRRLGRRQKALGVRAEHYPMIAEALLATFSSRLGEQWTTEMQTAWIEAYEAMVGLMNDGDMSPPVFVSLQCYGSQDTLLSF